MEKRILDTIGLTQKQVRQLVPHLNELLANLQLHYQNLRGLHWNIKGNNFFELHAKFEELYNDIQKKIDVVAERILTLGATPLHTYSDYLKTTNIEEGKNISDERASVELIINNLAKLLHIERSVLELSDELGDEGTNAMASDFIREQEKLVWMFSAWLNR